METKTDRTIVGKRKEEKKDIIGYLDCGINIVLVNSNSDSH